MTAEFNITIPGAEIIKRLADLETQVRDLESLTAYVGQLEKFIRDIENDVDRLSETPPAFDPAQIKQLQEHIDKVDKDAAKWLYKIDGRLDALERAKPAPAPASALDPNTRTRWEPYDVQVDFIIGNYPRAEKRVVVMLRGADHILPPQPAGQHQWSECGDFTIIAWRYAKEGE